VGQQDGETGPKANLGRPKR